MFLSGSMVVSAVRSISSGLKNSVSDGVVSVVVVAVVVVSELSVSSDESEVVVSVSVVSEAIVPVSEGAVSQAHKSMPQAMARAATDLSFPEFDLLFTIYPAYIPFTNKCNYIP